MVNFPTEYDYGAVSDPGTVRETNEDSLGFYRRGDAVLAVVADGIGGHRGGETASRICVEIMRDVFLGSGSDVPERILREGLLLAHAAVLRESAADRRLAGMGATVVAAVLREGQCWYTHLGDSRIYHVRPDKVERLTRDHTVLQELLEQGVISEKEAAGHRMAHVISKAAGHLNPGDAGIEVGKVSLSAGSTLVLCSDGLTDLVSDQEIQGMVAGVEARKACHDLLQLVLARGGHDNVTIQVIRPTYLLP